MNGISEKSGESNERDAKRYKKPNKKQEAIRPPSILSNTSTRTSMKTAIRENGRYQSRSGSVSRTSFISERNGDRNTERSDREPLSLRGTQIQRKTHRANSLPATCSRRFSFETNLRQTRMTKKSGQSRRHDKREIECRSAECIFHQRMSLDLSQLSDFADSEGESRDTVRQSTKRTESRRRRSVEKTNRILSGSQVIRSSSNSPSSKVSCSHKLTRRSSLQSFSPKALSFASSFDNSRRMSGTYSIRNQDGRRTSSATTLRKSSLGSSLSRHSELLFSNSNSPDYTSDASTCELSPCKLSPNGVSITPVLQKVKHDSTMSNIESNMATISPNSQIPCISSSSSCYTSWIESEHTYQGEESMDGNASENTPMKEKGEWNNFWQNYNSSLAAFPKKFFYDDCPTPFYEQDGSVDMKAFEIDPVKLDGGKKVTEKIKHSEKSKSGERKVVTLSRNEAKEMIHCAHRLAEILTFALDRNNEKNIKNETAKNYKFEELRNGGTKGEKDEVEETVGKMRDKRMETVPEKKELPGKSDERNERKKRELKDITVIRGDSKDVLL